MAIVIQKLPQLLIATHLSYILGIRIPVDTRTETSTYYMTVSRDSHNNVSFQKYKNEEEFKKATNDW